MSMIKRIHNSPRSANGSIINLEVQTDPNVRKNDQPSISAIACTPTQNEKTPPTHKKLVMKLITFSWETRLKIPVRKVAYESSSPSSVFEQPTG